MGSVPDMTVLELTTIVREYNQSLELKSSVEPNNFRFHVSTPKVACADPAAWCAAVSQIMKGNPLQSSVLKLNYNFNNEQRVDFYVVEASIGRSIGKRSSHLGESFPFYSDFGAECTLIKEFVAPWFSGKRMTGRSWQEAIGEIQLALNCTTNRVTKSSPLELLIRKTARPYGLLLPDDFVEKEVDISNVRQQAIDTHPECEVIPFKSFRSTLQR